MRNKKGGLKDAELMLWALRLLIVKKRLLRGSYFFYEINATPHGLHARAGGATEPAMLMRKLEVYPPNEVNLPTPYTSFRSVTSVEVYPPHYPHTYGFGG